MPGWSAVLALYSLQNIMMFTPYKTRRFRGGEMVTGRQRRGELLARTQGLGFRRDDARVRGGARRRLDRRGASRARGNVRGNSRERARGRSNGTATRRRPVRARLRTRSPFLAAEVAERASGPGGTGFGRRTHLSTERRTDGGRGVGLAGLDGQLNVPRNLRRHGGDAAGAALARGGRRDAEAQALTTEIRAATRGEGAAEMRARGRRRASRAGDARLLHPHGREARHSHAHSSHGSWYTCVSCARTDGDEDTGLWQ